MKLYFWIFLALPIGLLNAQEVPTKHFQKAFGQLDFLSIKMPETTIPNEANMGFTGIHYNLKMNDWSYAGVAIYGSATGQRGGFFTLGANLGIQKKFSKNFFIDSGIHFGGGGGAAAPDGGGAFLLGHANLGYQFPHFSITAGWSAIDFFDGGLIQNQQWNAALQIPLSFDYALHASHEKEYPVSAFLPTPWHQKSKKIGMLLHLNNLNVGSKVANTENAYLNGQTIRLAGFEFDVYLNPQWFVFLKADGAYHGIQAGYMDVLMGGGYDFSMNKNRTHFLAKFGFGAGGGGGVDTRGGFLLYPDFSIEQKISKEVSLSLNKGYLFTPDQHFFTSTYGMGVKYTAHVNGTESEIQSFASGKFKGFELSLGQELYWKAKRGSNPTENLQQISMQLTIELNQHLYIAGQTSFANFGNAGAYAEGIVGIGAKTTPLSGLQTSFFTQVLAGAAGGGDISTQQGLIFKNSYGIDQPLSKTLSVQLSGGIVKSLGGGLNSPILNIGIKYRFSYLKFQ